MKVRLTLDLFRTTVCELRIEDSALVFSCPGQTELTLPFSQIRRFDVEGEGVGRKRFTIETEGKLYEGRFLQRGDAELVTRVLCKSTDCYVNLCLETPPVPRGGDGPE